MKKKTKVRENKVIEPELLVRLLNTVRIGFNGYQASGYQAENNWIVIWVNLDLSSML